MREARSSAAAEPGLVCLFCVVLLGTHILDNPEPRVTVCMRLNSLHAHICALNCSFHVLCFSAVCVVIFSILLSS